MSNSPSFCLVSISCGLTGGSLFSTVSKCSFQIFSLSLCSFVGFPFLSLTTVLVQQVQIQSVDIIAKT